MRTPSLILAFIVSALAAVLLASPALAVETYKLTFVSHPIQRHVQVQAVVGAHHDGTETYADDREWADLPTAVVSGLATSLDAWLGGAPLKNPPTIWSLWRTVYIGGVPCFSILEFTERPEHRLLISFSTAYTVSSGRGALPSTTATNVRFELSEVEAVALTNALQAWLPPPQGQGWDGDDGDLWRRVEGDGE